MKKFFAIFFITVLLINISPCFADSLLEKFEEQLKGTWEYYNILGEKPNQNKPNVEKFTFSSNNKGNVYGYGRKKMMNFDMHLFEAGNGEIWLILSRNKDGFYVSAKIAMSKDGNFLYIVDSTMYQYFSEDYDHLFTRKDWDFYGIYKKVAK